MSLEGELIKTQQETCVRTKATVASTPADILIGYWPIVTTIIEFLCQYYVTHPKNVLTASGAHPDVY
jgi:hypothetical protein